MKGQENKTRGRGGWKRSNTDKHLGSEEEEAVEGAKKEMKF